MRAALTPPFRLAGPADVDALVTLVNSAYRGETSRKGWTTEADLLEGIRIDTETLLAHLADPDTYHILVAAKADTLLACMELTLDGPSACLGMFSVQPSLQGGGMGKRFLREAEAYSRSLGVGRLWMEVISVRSELIAWYARRGYVDTGRRTPFVPEKSDFAQTDLQLQFAILEKHL